MEDGNYFTNCSFESCFINNLFKILRVVFVGLRELCLAVHLIKSVFKKQDLAKYLFHYTKDCVKTSENTYE